jgi:hypothetical protein
MKTTKAARIAREKDRSNFHLDQLPSSSAVIFEEPIIDQTTVGNWKLLLEGSPIPTDMKHSDKEIIHRIPIFITTNQDIWSWISPDDIAPIKQRITIYKLKHTITNAINVEGQIEKPPSILTHHDIDALIIHHYDDILLKLGSLTSNTLMYNERKQLSTNIIMKLERLQSQLLLFQDNTINEASTSHATE